MVTKAVILAAGRGTRMQSLTAELPKPMLALKGKPILEHVLDGLRAAGCSEALIVTGYLAEVIERHFTRYPMAITFARQEQTNGTASAALLAREFAGADPFLLTFGDIMAEPADYRGIADLLEQDPDATAAVGVKHVPDPWQGAAVYEEGGRITRIVEKPAPGTSTSNWNSAGLYAFRPAVFDALAAAPLSARGEYELTSAIEALIADGRLLLLYALEGPWRDVGRPEDLS